MKQWSVVDPGIPEGAPTSQGGMQPIILQLDPPLMVIKSRDSRMNAKNVLIMGKRFSLIRHIKHADDEVYVFRYKELCFYY